MRMPENVPMSIRASHACLLAFALAPVHAAEWQRPIAPEAERALEVTHVLPDGDGYVLAGTSWVRVGSDGSVRLADPALLPPALDLRGDVAPLGPNRFLRVGTGSGVTEIVDGHGTRLAATADAAPDVHAFVAHAFDGGGGLWVPHLTPPGGGATWGRMQADGRVRAIALPPDATMPWNGGASFAPLRDAPAAYALYRATQKVHIAKVERRGVEWSLAPPAADIEFRSVVTLDDGDALVTGKQGEARGILWLGRYGRDGTLRWQRTYPELVPGRLSIHSLRLDGDRVVLAAPDNFDGENQGRWLAAFDAQGTPLWRRNLIGETFHGFVPHPPGEAEPAFGYWSSMVATSPDTLNATELVHVDASGRTVARHAGVGAAAVLRDGSLVALHPPFPDSGPYAPSVRRHALDGSVTNGPPLGLLLPASREPFRGALLENGDSVSLSQGPGRTLQVRLFDAGGARRWERVLPPFSDARMVLGDDRLLDRHYRIAAGPERVCIGPAYLHYEFFSIQRLEIADLLRCFRRADGATLFDDRGTLAGGQNWFKPLPALAVRADGRVLQVETDGTDFFRSTLSADGARLERLTLAAGIGQPSHPDRTQGVNALAAFRADHALAVLVSNVASGEFALLTAEAEGAATSAFRHAGDHGTLLRVEALGGGDWLLHSRLRNGEHALARLAPDGAQRWRRSFPVAEAGLGESLLPLAFAADASHVLVATHARQPGTDRLQSTLTVLDGASGTPRWSEAQSLLPSRGVHAVVLDALRGLALALRDTPDRPVLTAYALADGTERGKRALDCMPAPGCAPLALALAGDGSLRSFGAGFDAARLELDSTLQPAPLGQQALLGTWYAPGTTGQGLLIDYSANSGDLLAGWFTYDGDGVYDARGLRWYTLGGLATPNAASAELDLYRNASGQFAGGPRTAAERIGSARLRLHGCDELLLSYRFDSGEHAGLQGEVSLTRLTPALFPCTEGDGRVHLPALDAVAPQDGPSQAHSGAWYAAEQSGQGLLFDLRPPTAERAGHLVGGWFTYDPAGQADDPAAQHWFLLDGDLVPPGGPVARFKVPIYRAVGGRFDLRPTRTVHRVGEAELRFGSCASATLDYRFDDTDLAAEFAGRHGSLALQRLLPCPH
jgi:hypothetical protein